MRSGRRYFRSSKKNRGFSDFFALFVHTQYEQKLSEMTKIFRCFQKNKKSTSSIHFSWWYRGASPYRVLKRLRGCKTIFKTWIFRFLSISVHTQYEQKLLEMMKIVRFKKNTIQNPNLQYIFHHHTAGQVPIGSWNDCAGAKLTKNLDFSDFLLFLYILSMYKSCRKWWPFWDFFHKK